MIYKLKNNKIKRLLLYIFFGILTTAVNIFSFWLLTDMLCVQYLISNFIAIVTSVLFAYITNKLYVFKSKTKTKKGLIREVIIFSSARTGTLIFDMIAMFILVSLFNLDLFISKIFTNITVIILNYVFSRLFVFKKNE